MSEATSLQTEFLDLDLGRLPPELRSAEVDRYGAMIHADAQALERSLAEDLRYTHSSGSVDGRESYITTLQSGLLRYGAIACSIEDATLVSATTCVAVGTFSARVVVGGEPRQISTRFAAAWRCDERWRLVFWHSLGVPAA